MLPDMRSTFASQQDRAFSRVDLVVVIALLLLVLATLLPPMLTAAHRRAQRIQCANNLDQIFQAFRGWIDEREDRFPGYPASVSVRSGGTMELNNGTNAWINFAVLSNEFELSNDLSNELSAPSEFLHCPADTERSEATNFNDLEGKISYFINLDANVFFSDMPLDGDDNFAINGIPVKSGLLGLSPNTPISWTAARHKFVGNIGFADGSVAKISNSGLLKALEQTGPSTNGPITEWEAIREHNGISINRLAIP